MLVIKGKTIDTSGRCQHWHSKRDIIAIRFPCCGAYYACYQCHEELADHPAQRWPKVAFEQEKAVLCGACRHAMTISDYLSSGSQCPQCGADFNPRCSLHWPLYFEV